MEELGQQLMPDREVHVKRDADELNRAAADLFIEIARRSIDDHQNFSVALSGGSTPRSLYCLLSSDNYRSAIDWKQVTFFFGDERNVPPDSGQSNYRMAYETLLGPLGIRAEHIHRWETELPSLDDAASRYEEVIRGFCGSSKPGLDFILLGLGDDAHTASLFPHTPALKEKAKFAITNRVEKLNTDRLTLTFPFINRAANIVFLVTGKSKAEAVAHVLEGEYRPDDYPAQLVEPLGGRVIWLIDEAAASLLKDA
ncbi:MAG: 6-phosphogluconolactonase [Pyrinomonadaceae bacterium]